MRVDMLKKPSKKVDLLREKKRKKDKKVRFCLGNILVKAREFLKQAKAQKSNIFRLTVSLSLFINTLFIINECKNVSLKMFDSQFSIRPQA